MVEAERERRAQHEDETEQLRAENERLQDQVEEHIDTDRMPRRSRT